MPLNRTLMTGIAIGALSAAAVGGLAYFAGRMSTVEGLRPAAEPGTPTSAPSAAPAATVTQGAAAAAEAQAAADPQENVRRALNAFDNNDPEVAEALLTKAIDSGQLMGQELSVAYFYRARARNALVYSQGAVEDATKAIEVSANSPFAYHERAKAQLNLRNFDAAIADLGQAMTMLPGVADFAFARCFAYLQKNDLANALKDCRTAAETGRTVALYWATVGSIHEQMQDKQAAEAAYRKALDLDPNDATAKAGLRNLGRP